MILVTGVAGQLGYDVVKELNKRNMHCIGVDKSEVDITNKEAVENLIREVKPEAVIHCAAYTSVDKAEDDFEMCFDVNVNGTLNIAEACKSIGAKMMYISTDYVFEGTGKEYHEVNDIKSPMSVYGKTKLEGEFKVLDNVKNHFIVRISWVYGENGNNFVKTMLKIGMEKEEINVVSDQVGSPTNTSDLALLLCDMIVTEKYGIYHATNEGSCNWAEFAEKIFKISNINCKVNYIASSEYKTRALRPLNSLLSKKSIDLAGFNRLPNWELSLKEYLKKIM